MSTSSSSAIGTYFNGESNFSAQLNIVISRSLARETLPITELQNQQSTLTSEQAEIQTLGSDFVAVQTAISSLNTAASASSYSASVDTPAVATASVSAGALPGTYSLTVTSLGSQTNTISGSGSTTVSDPTTQNISAASSFTLAVDGTNFTVSPAGTSLDDLVTAINSSGANVQATIVNVGGTAHPDYRLSVQAAQYAPATISLSDGTNSLLTSLHTGSYVTYQVNGQPSTAINSTSRTLSLSTGLSADALTTGTANITVSASSSSMSSALTSYVTAYNAAAAELTKNRGQNGGALAGDPLIAQLQENLNFVGGYTSATPSTTLNSLADIGLTFDSVGNLSFDSSKFDAAFSTSPSALKTFLGSQTGGGFIQSAYTALTSLTDSTSGAITVAGNTIGTSITSLTSQISTKQAAVTQMQTNLTAQMSAADSAISALQNQLSEITSLFTAETQASRNITG